MSLTFNTLNWFFRTKHGENSKCLERDEELVKEGEGVRGESKDGDTFPAKRPKNQSVVVVVRGVSMVTHLQLYHRRGGYSLYNLLIYFKEIWLWNLLLSYPQS